ncbi:hypothetical protein [Pseudomonas sp. IAC-BECa141]|uniref:hypothetical protein n=1 Tax=Pseudomonas sp. IAC-BECa141 TaxID=2793103 RepID=UPI001D0947AC|nr:hypothetical protein [Pseudomonas sp. IAC-BECa141]UDI95243.1 hypothetical protein I5961_12295 [Pseudomonas sp. IAC-BECa141]
MTRKIEDKAKIYLLYEFKHESCSFHDKDISDKGFDIWLNETNQKPRKVELKATDSAYQRPSNIFERLVFNAEIEKQLFESGESIIARVFMGSVPPRVFLITNAIFNGGAKLNSEARYVVRGKINYENSISELI